MVHFEHRYDRLWERLLVLLDTLGDVEPTSPGRLRLSVEGFTVELVITEQEWEDLVTIPNGSFVGGANHLLHMIGKAQMERAPYLVYDTYELHAGQTDLKPTQAEMEADRARVAEFRKQNPSARPEWRAHSPVQDDPS